MAHVIVVEDDATNARVAQRVLARMGGHDVTLIEDGDEVLRLCDARAVDLVIMDVSLANTRVDGRAVDGAELTRLIRDRCGTRSPAILLVTAHAMRGDRVRLLAASGADDYICKPIVDHRALVDRVEALLVRRAA